MMKPMIAATCALACLALAACSAQDAGNNATADANVADANLVDANTTLLPADENGMAVGDGAEGKPGAGDPNTPMGEKPVIEGGEDVNISQPVDKVPG